MWAKQKGFTIVELLIVIIVIAILAAITTVAFNGIKARAIESEKTTKMANIYKALINFQTVNGYYPSTDEITGSSGASLLSLKLADVVPSDSNNPNNGIEAGYAGASDYNFKYFTWPNADGSGFGGECGTATYPNKCKSFLLAYYDRVANQTKSRINPDR